MAKKSASQPKHVLSETDAQRLVAAGFAPVVRWVDVRNGSDTPLKGVEALTLLDRRGERKGK